MTIQKTHHWSILKKEVSECKSLNELDADTDSECMESCTFSLRFLREKKNNSQRLILNLTELSSILSKHHLKQTLFRISIKYDRKRMFSVDLIDAYYTVPFKSSFCIFLSFNLKKNYIRMHIYLKALCLPQEFVQKILNLFCPHCES